jgi:hypothetical protein
LSAREVREKIHWLRGFGLVSSFRASDGYVFFLPINPKLHDLRGRVV